jgi:hypothetical protein
LFGPGGIVGPEVVEFIGRVSLLAPVFGSVMPELTGGLLAPEASAEPPYTGPGAVPPELFPATVPGSLVLGPDMAEGAAWAKGDWDGRADGYSERSGEHKRIELFFFCIISS